ncbi:MAG: type IV pilin [Candidatus Heimdallarchaeaceae archaeon]
MKKRGVSPVIATVLLIALVTAAAAIVFLVVIPMLNPTAKPIFTYQDGSTDLGGGTRQIKVDVRASGGSLTIESVTVSPTLTISVVNATDGSMIGQTIEAEATVSILLKGAFVVGTDYTFTFTFTSGDDTISESITVTA